jgi:hypothetical protein
MVAPVVRPESVVNRRKVISASLGTGWECSPAQRIRLDSAVKKEEIKVRLVKPGLLEIEWPRATGEEIPVE